MTTRTFRFIVSTALAAGLLSGCSGMSAKPAKMAAQAAAALKGSDSGRAVSLAEQAVLADPRNASYRQLLGTAYMRAGRFESAAQAFDEAMQLGADDGKAALSLALVDVALGRLPEARGLLDAHRDRLAVSDFGLALAMAGDTGRAVSVLTDALRNHENTPKIRQNLAYAYALDGRWAEARIMAAQDVPVAQLDARMQEWAGQAQPGEARQRVAALLDVPLRGDEGQPAALALANFPEPQQLADAAQARIDAQPQLEAQAAAAPALAEAAARELPAIDEQPGTAQPSVVALIDKAPVPAAMMAPAPAAAHGVTFTSIPVVQPIARPYRAAGTYAGLAKAAPRVDALASAKADTTTPELFGSHLVQLGAFGSEQAAHRAWAGFQQRNPSLKDYRNVTAPVTVRGHKFWRVQALGFNGRASAASLCGTIKARGGACFVMAVQATPTVPGGVSDAKLARRR